MKKIFGIYGLMFFIIWLASCKPVDMAEQNDGNVVVEINKESLSKMQSSICLGEEQLVEVDYGSVERFYDVAAKYKAFGFLRGTGRCALKKDFNRNGIDDWFSITLYDDCLTNGTLWIPKIISHPSHTLRMELYEYGGNPDRVTRIYSGYEVKLRELQSVAGVKAYKCVPK